MIDIRNLTRGQRNAYEDALRTSHRIRIETTIRNRNEQPITSLSAPINRVLSGSVQVDTTADVSRSLALTVLDSQGRLNFDAKSPAHGAVYGDNFISVRYEVWVATMDEWVSVPVFWGPVTGYSRAGGEVELEAQGKETLLLAPIFVGKGYTLNKTLELGEAIKRVAKKAGEGRFDLPALDHKLTKARAVTAQEEPWKVLAGGGENSAGKRVAGLVQKAAGDRKIFYDTRGRLTVRKLRTKPVWTFREGRDLTAHPSVAYDLTEFINTVDVRGVAPKGKPPAHARVSLPDNHPLSPSSLARNGVDREMILFVESELKTDTACARRAKAVLKRKADAGVDASFECLPCPHLQEGDLVRVKTSEWDLEFRPKSWTLPLSADAMSIGHNRKVSKFRRKRRRPT